MITIEKFIRDNFKSLVNDILSEINRGKYPSRKCIAEELDLQCDEEGVYLEGEEIFYFEVEDFPFCCGYKVIGCFGNISHFDKLTKKQKGIFFYLVLRELNLGTNIMFTDSKRDDIIYHFMEYIPGAKIIKSATPDGKSVLKAGVVEAKALKTKTFPKAPYQK